MVILIGMGDHRIKNQQNHNQKDQQNHTDNISNNKIPWNT